MKKVLIALAALMFAMPTFLPVVCAQDAATIKQNMINRLPAIAALKSKGVIGEDNCGFLAPCPVRLARPTRPSSTPKTPTARSSMKPSPKKPAPLLNSSASNAPNKSPRRPPKASISWTKMAPGPKNNAVFLSADVAVFLSADYAD